MSNTAAENMASVGMVIHVKTNRAETRYEDYDVDAADDEGSGVLYDKHHDDDDDDDV